MGIKLTKIKISNVHYVNNRIPVWSTGNILTSIIENSPVNTSLIAIDPDGDIVSYSVAPLSTLPIGLSLSSGGVLSGIAPAHATYNFTVRATDTNGAFVDRTFTLVTISSINWSSWNSTGDGKTDVLVSSLGFTPVPVKLTMLTATTGAFLFNQGIYAITYPSTGIEYSTVTPFGSGTLVPFISNGQEMVTLDSTRVLIVGDGGSEIFAEVATYNGTSFVVGAKVNVTNNEGFAAVTISSRIQIIVLDSARVAVLYMDNTNFKLKTRVLTISGSTITVNAPSDVVTGLSSFGNHVLGQCSLISGSTSDVAICYTTNSNVSSNRRNMIAVATYGATSFSSVQTITNASPGSTDIKLGGISIISLSSTTGMIFYGRNTGANIKWASASISFSGNSISSIGTELLINSSNVDQASDVYPLMTGVSTTDVITIFNDTTSDVLTTIRLSLDTGNTVTKSNQYRTVMGDGSYFSAKQIDENRVGVFAMVHDASQGTYKLLTSVIAIPNLAIPIYSFKNSGSGFAYIGYETANFPSFNRKTFAISLWFKNSEVAGTSFISRLDSGTNQFNFGITNNKLDFVTYADGTNINGRLQSTTHYQDGLWHHALVTYDSTQSTASNRMTMWVDGVQVTAFDINAMPSLNDSVFNNTVSHMILGYQFYQFAFMDTIPTISQLYGPLSPHVVDISSLSGLKMLMQVPGGIVATDLANTTTSWVPSGNSNNPIVVSTDTPLSWSAWNGSLDGSPTQFETATSNVTAHTSSCIMSTDKTIVVYTFGSLLKAKIVSTTGKTITPNTPITIATNTISATAVCTIDSTRAMVIYRDNTIGELRAVVVTVSGTSLAFGSIATVAVLSGSSNNFASVTNITTDQCITVWEEAGVGNKAVCLSTVGNVITVRTPFTFSTDNSANSLAVVAVNSTTAYVAYSRSNSDNFGLNRILSISGNTITTPTPEATFNSSFTNRLTVCALDSSHVINVYSNNNTGTIDAVVSSISGTTITNGSPTICDNNGSSLLSTTSQDVVVLDPSTAFVTYRKSSILSGVVLSVSGTSVIPSPIVAIQNILSDYYNNVVLDSTRILTIYTDEGPGVGQGTGLVISTI